MSRGRIIIALLAVVVVVNAAVFPTAARRMNELATTPVRPLDLRPAGYSPADAHAMLQSLGSEGRRFYVTIETTVDVVYPIVYAIMFFLAIHWLADRAPAPATWPRRAALLPVAAAALDVAENVGILRMVQRFPERADTAARISSTFTTIKWACFAVTLLVVLWLGARALTRRARVAA